MHCPGQDRRYWKDDAVFNIPCPRCAHLVEMFKDEKLGRCRQCNLCFNNPKVAFDCASWCEYAEECTGIRGGTTTVPFESSLANRLLRTVEAEVQSDQSAHIASLLNFQHASELLVAERADSRVVLSASLLLPLYSPDRQKSLSGPETETAGIKAVNIEDLLRRIGFEAATVDQIVQLLKNFCHGGAVDTPESRVLGDAELLAQASMEGGLHDDARLEDLVCRQLRTESGKKRARQLWQKTS